MSDLASELRGLVLMGGESRRMGTDKAGLVYHESPQWQHVAAQLALHCPSVYWSCNEGQKLKWNLGENAIVDELPGTGPIGGLATAFRSAACAWLVVACDYPFLDVSTLSLLVASRNPAFDVTAIGNPEDGGPEPFLAIWEPSSQAALLEGVARGEDSPRRVLNTLSVKIVGGVLPPVLENVNQLSW